MPRHYRCPECGEVFAEDTPCPACLCDTLPDTTHAPMNLASDELQGSELAIAQLMRQNRGCEL